MKQVIPVTVAIFCLTVAASGANGGQKSVAGLVVGGGTGAIVGQAVGHNVESAVIGATVGGVVGLIIGSELERNHVVVHDYHRPRIIHHRPVYYPPPKRWHKQYRRDMRYWQPHPPAHYPRHRVDNPKHRHRPRHYDDHPRRRYYR